MSMPIPETSPEFDRTRIIERPDGSTGRTRRAARNSDRFPPSPRRSRTWNTVPTRRRNSGRQLRGAEDSLGIADWIDEETGLPAEEFVPRIEDH